MKTPIWQPRNPQTTQLYQFKKNIEHQYQIELAGYRELHQWSVSNIAEFWQQIWNQCQIKYTQSYDTIMETGECFYDTQWFTNSRLNYAENLLSRRDNHIAIVSHLENGKRTTLTYSELYQQVSSIAYHLRSIGIQSGDRVVGVVANSSEAIIAMLATTSIGAIWSSCSPDFGLQASLDRFGQIKPRVLIAVDGYYYGGKIVHCIDKVNELHNTLGIEETLLIPLLDRGTKIANSTNPKVTSKITSKTVDWDDIVNKYKDAELTFSQEAFNHPLFIMYSSGTTGKPKCIVHSAGGTLLQHLKEHRLHTDLSQDDVFFYFTTCGWMMWNWLVSGLATGATLVLYDGNPLNNTSSLLDIIDQEKISIFGTSAKYLDMLQKRNAKPKDTHSLTALRIILSTGSPLVAERFEYIYAAFKEDLLLASISGGTDIISCFLLGNPTLPVYAGELQCAGLGFDVHVFNEKGQSIKQEQGELVCTQPFPCCPLGFWNDAGNIKFKQAYFERFDNVWAHGDYAEVTEQNGYIIYGRSDTVLNPGGVRIGTAEIYRQAEKVTTVQESIAIGQKWDDDVRVILFVSLTEGINLDQSIIDEICQTIKANASPRHVPAKILQVSAIPKTRSGKITEKLVNKLVNNEEVDNIDALQNPEVLIEFTNRKELTE